MDGLIKCGDRLSDVNLEQINGLEFEFGCGKNYSINEIVVMFGIDCSKEYIEKRDGEYDVTLADYSKANKILGWRPIKDIKSYILEALTVDKNKAI